MLIPKRTPTFQSGYSQVGLLIHLYLTLIKYPTLHPHFAFQSAIALFPSPSLRASPLHPHSSPQVTWVSSTSPKCRPYRPGKRPSQHTASINKVPGSPVNYFSLDRNLTKRCLEPPEEEKKTNRRLPARLHYSTMNNFPAQQLNEEQPAANMGMSNADTDMHGLAAYDFVTLEVPLSLYDVSAYDALMHGYEVISGDPMPSYDANIDMAYYLDNPVSGSDDTAASSAVSCLPLPWQQQLMGRYMTQDSDFSIITNVDVDVAMLDNNRPSHNEATPPQGTSWSSEAYVDPPIAAFGPMFPTGTGTDTSTNLSVATPSLDSQAASDGEGSGESVQVFNIVCAYFRVSRGPVTVNVEPCLLLPLRTL